MGIHLTKEIAIIHICLTKETIEVCLVSLTFVERPIPQLCFVQLSLIDYATVLSHLLPLPGSCHPQSMLVGPVNLSITHSFYMGKEVLYVK